MYSGAGISVAAGIGQAARGAARGSRGTDAEPTPAHFALAALHRAGLLHGWVQQNHDGLPQKAGFPQVRRRHESGSGAADAELFCRSGTAVNTRWPPLCAPQLIYGRKQPDWCVGGVKS